MAILDEAGLQTLEAFEKKFPGLLTQVSAEAKALIDHGIKEFRDKMGTLVQEDIVLAVNELEEKARALVDHGVDRTSKEAKQLIGELSLEIAQQREGMRRDLLRVVPWAAAIIGVMNAATILLVWMLAGKA